MRALTLIAFVPFALGQLDMLNLDCTNYPGPCNNDCYAAYVANKPIVRKICPPQEKILVLTSVLRPSTTMGPMASPTHAGARLVVLVLPHAAMASCQRRALMRTPVMNILTRLLSRAALDQFFGALATMRTAQRVRT